ncbi:MAG: CPBP family glutamic-type intramembrane protease [Holophagaceae bacterium]
MLPVPWWLPALVFGAARLAWPARPFVAVLAYHAVCLMGLKGPFAWGRIERRDLPVLVAAFALLPLQLLLPPLSFFPRVQVQTLLAGWPGGLWSWAVYALVFNVTVEEAFWRGTILRRHGWPAWAHGAAFGLHHAVAAAISLPWVWIPPALVATSLAGGLLTRLARTREGLGLAVLTHLWADAAIVLLVVSQR